MMGRISREFGESFGLPSYWQIIDCVIEALIRMIVGWLVVDTTIGDPTEMPSVDYVKSIRRLPCKLGR
ncbi:hypothetical protein [Vulcanisaeta moutnovskia]|uniref:hypothetical protein n=1 Tax=Vulcanisaeta moutnovskia TaxID=985052 RepID=UPI00064F51BC|nr:hypothetical protein [Vulcanisaeta moutnovskia]